MKYCLRFGSATIFILVGSVSAASTAQVPLSTYAGDYVTIVDEAGFWSNSSRVFDAQFSSSSHVLNGADASYDIQGSSRNETGQHFQGVTYLENGMFVAVHSLAPTNIATCAALVWTSPYNYDDDPDEIRAQAECGLLNKNHSSDIDSHGNIVVVPDYHYYDGEPDPTGSTSRNAVRFFDFTSGRPVELSHLRIGGGVSSVGLAQRSADGHFYLATASVGEHDYSDVKMYRAEKSPVDSTTGKGGACGLTDSDCKFVYIGSVGSVYVSSSGMSLVDLSDGLMMIFTMYSPNGLVNDFVRGTAVMVDPFSMFPLVVTPLDGDGENVGVSQTWQAKTMRPSCRWSCSMSMVNGHLYFSSISRDVESQGDFELSLYRVDSND